MHTLVFIDQIKVNTAFRLASAKEVSKDYSIAAVVFNLIIKHRPEKRAVFIIAGGSELTR
jgi:hypothetical protein